jgi:hypothetical protein
MRGSSKPTKTEDMLLDGVTLWDSDGDGCMLGTGRIAADSEVDRETVGEDVPVLDRAAVMDADSDTEDDFEIEADCVRDVDCVRDADCVREVDCE